jgi:hypothetical protein
MRKAINFFKFLITAMRAQVSLRRITVQLVVLEIKMHQIATLRKTATNRFLGAACSRLLTQYLKVARFESLLAESGRFRVLATRRELHQVRGKSTKVGTKASV